MPTNPLSAWSDFQREALKQLGIDTLDMFERVAPVEVADASVEHRPSEVSDLTESTLPLSAHSQPAQPAQNVPVSDASSPVQNATQTTTKEAVEQTAKPPQPSIVEIGQREAWKAAINNAHGCFITATVTLANDKKLLIITESPKITTQSETEQVFAEEDLAKLTMDMLASIHLTELNFTRWQNVIDYLPYERRDDPEPDTERFHADFAGQLDNISYILAFGQLTAKLILKTTASIGKLRGQTHTVNLNGQNCTVNALYHPAFLLRAPTHKKTQWQDLKLAYRTIHQRG